MTALHGEAGAPVVASHPIPSTSSPSWHVMTHMGHQRVRVWARVRGRLRRGSHLVTDALARAAAEWDVCKVGRDLVRVQRAAARLWVVACRGTHAAHAVQLVRGGVGPAGMHAEVVVLQRCDANTPYTGVQAARHPSMEKQALFSWGASRCDICNAAGRPLVSMRGRQQAKIQLSAVSLSIAVSSGLMPYCRHAPHLPTCRRSPG